MGLALVLMIPLVGMLAVVLAGPRAGLARIVALVTSGAGVVVAAGTCATYLTNGETLVFTLGNGAVSSMVTLVGDGLSLPMVLLTTVAGLIAVCAGVSAERVGAHLALLLGLQAAVTGVFLAGDLVFLYVMWEAVLIPMFFLIGGWGHENRRYAAMKFFLYTFAGSVLMLVGVVVLAFARGGVTQMGGPVTALEPGVQGAVFWLLAAGLLVKVPVWPLHTWLPDAHVEAPTSGSIMLAGVLLKMGGYGLIRLCIGFTPDAFLTYAPVLAVLGIVGTVYGAAMALAQSDLKRLIAYSSIAHMGFVVLAISAGTEAGLQAALVGMVSHGLVAGMLFFLAGALYDRAHTREMGRFGGLGVSMPGWSSAFVFGMLASAGLPGLSGFPGEFGALIESYARFGWPAALTGVGVVLAGAYGLRAVRVVVQGETGTDEAWPDLRWGEVVPVVALVVLIVSIGVWPRALTDVSAGTLSALSSLLKAVP